MAAGAQNLQAALFLYSGRQNAFPVCMSPVGHLQRYQAAFHSPDSFVLSGFYCTLLTFNWVTLGGKCTFFLINLASILIVYDYCVPVQMVMQMAMGAMQVCVSVQTLFLNLAICDASLE